jgi:hypothetical protein
MAANDVYRALRELRAGPVEDLYADLNELGEEFEDVAAEVTANLDEVAQQLEVAAKTLHALLTAGD